VFFLLFSEQTQIISLHIINALGFVIEAIFIVRKGKNNLFSPRAASQGGPRPPRSWSLWITHNVPSQTAGLLWTGDQLVTETSTWQHTTLTTDRHPCPRRNWNPQSQKASGGRTAPWNARPLGSVKYL